MFEKSLQWLRKFLKLLNLYTVEKVFELLPRACDKIKEAKLEIEKFRKIMLRVRGGGCEYLIYVVVVPSRLCKTLFIEQLNMHQYRQSFIEKNSVLPCYCICQRCLGN